MAQKKRERLQISDRDMSQLKTYSVSRMETSSKVDRSRIIIDYAKGMTIAGIVRKYGTNRPLVERTVDKAIHFGPIAALDDLPRSGRPPEITDQARAWVVSIACVKPTDFGYAAQTWTYSALAKYLRENCVAAGFPSLINTGKSFLNNVLSKSNIKPHKISYYLEKKTPNLM